MKYTESQPYVYKLVNKLTNEFYIGYRKNNKHPAEVDLGTYYFTSSRYIDKTNFNEYRVYILEKFDDHVAAYNFEQRLIFENWGSSLLLNKSCFHDKKQFINHPGYSLSEDFKKKRSILTKGKNNPMYGKTGKSSPNYGRKRPAQSKRMSGKNNPMYGQTHSDHIKTAHSIRMKGSVPHNQGKTYEDLYGSEKSRLLKEKLRKANLGKTVEVIQVECPHCKKIGSKVPMVRWHFENCKFKT